MLYERQSVHLGAQMLRRLAYEQPCQWRAEIKNRKIPAQW